MLAIETYAYGTSLNMSTASTNGTAFLGTTLGATFNASSLTAGAGSTYRLGGGSNPGQTTLAVLNFNSSALF